jgi:2-methylisocitrate lyase-like PEP mutase family enzyme
VLYAPDPPDLDALTAIVTAVAPTPVNVLISPADKVLTVAELHKAGGSPRGRPRLGDNRNQLRAH